MALQQLGNCIGESEAAKRLGISRITLLRARHRGEISHFRFGARVVYAEAHLAEYLSRQERRCAGAPSVALSAA